MSINRPGCGLLENDDFREINAFLSTIPLNFFSIIFYFQNVCQTGLWTSQISNKNQLRPWFFGHPASNKMAIKSKLLLFTIIIIVQLIDFSLCDDIK